MKYSKKVTNFIDHLVSYYARFDKKSDSYSLKIEDISDFDLHELAALIMASDDNYAAEATGFDNPYYAKSMLPALLRYMQNSTDKQEAYEFNKIWLNGIVDYFSDTIQEMLNIGCQTYLHTIRNELGSYAYRDRTDGEIYWNRAI